VALHFVSLAPGEIGFALQLVSTPAQSIGHAHAYAIALARAGKSRLAIEPTAQLPGLHADKWSHQSNGLHMPAQLSEPSQRLRNGC